MTDPDNLVLQLLRDMRAEMKSEFANVRSDIANVDSRVTSLAANVASDLLTIEKRLSEQIVGLRRAVMEYHSSAIGHGVLITEFEERLRRVEQHLNLPSSGSH